MAQNENKHGNTNVHMIEEYGHEEYYGEEGEDDEAVIKKFE